MAIASVPIRATIKFGGVSVKTPYILSFNVSKTRNSKSTFSASLKIPSDELNGMSDNEITISAGTKNNERLIFTGYVLSTRPSICFDDPSYTILNISGSDILYRLEGEKYTRRQMDSKSRWAVIEGVVRKAAKGGQFELLNTAVQIVDNDNISDTEKKNKGVTRGAPNLGPLNLTDGTRPVSFKFWPITYTD